MRDFADIEPGELVTLESWICEGVELPWGLNSADTWTKTDQPMSRRLNKVKIKPGSCAVVLDCKGLVATVDDFDKHLIVLFDGMQISVPIRFVHRMEA